MSKKSTQKKPTEFRRNQSVSHLSIDYNTSYNIKDNFFVHHSLKIKSDYISNQIYKFHSLDKYIHCRYIHSSYWIMLNNKFGKLSFYWPDTSIAVSIFLIYRELLTLVCCKNNLVFCELIKGNKWRILYVDDFAWHAALLNFYWSLKKTNNPERWYTVLANFNFHNKIYFFQLRIISRTR